MKIKRTLFTLASLSAINAAIAQEQPNIIFFFVDDMGWQDTSVPFHSDTTMWNRIFHTPNMERLAQQGVKFTNAYACPVSSPSRISLLTGVNATRHKVTNWTLHKDTSTDGENEFVEFEKWNYNGFSNDSTVENSYYGTALPEILRDNGYTTLFVGKAHFGAIGTPAENPLNIGFEENIAGHAVGGPGSYLGTKNFGESVWQVPGLEQYHGEDIFLSEALTLESLKLMDSALEKQKPFFLYMAHYAVHIPFDADMRFYQKYIDQGLVDQEARYASIVEGMDKSLGDIMDYLDRKGIADNTIIMFMSDNGGYSVGVRATTFDNINKNAPLRGGKGSVFEGGIREPMIVYAPGITTSGEVNDSQVIIEDFFPTILELAKIKKTEIIQQLDSKTFTKALQGKRINQNRPLYFHYPNDWGEKANECGTPCSAIIIGDMKLIHRYENSTNELYNIKQDISETRNLLTLGSKYQRVALRLAHQLTKKLKQENAPMPIRRDTGERCPYPDEVFPSSH